MLVAEKSKGNVHEKDKTTVHTHRLHTGWNPATAPRFRWRQAPLTEKHRVLIQTAIGDIEIELDAKHAPVTTKNFLRYVLEGFYSDGVFSARSQLQINRMILSRLP